MPVTEVKMIRSTSSGGEAGRRPARRRTASAPSSMAASMKASLAGPKPSSLAYCSSGSAR